MPSHGIERGFSPDLPATAAEVIAMTGSAEIGSNVPAAAKQRGAMGIRAPRTPDRGQSGSVDQASIEYWFFCGDGAAMRRP